MRRIIATLVTLLFLQSAHAQGEFAWTLNAQGNAGRTNLAFFDDYAAAYNELQSEKLEKELGNMRWSYGYGLGTSFYINALYLEVDFDNRYTQTKAVFTDPAMGTRHFKAHHRTSTLIIGFPIIGEDAFHITGGWFFGLDHLFIDSYRKYPSGDISFGDESYTNGKFRGKNLTMGLDFGVNINLAERWVLHSGLRLGFSLKGDEIREIYQDRGLTLPGMNWENGIPSMVRCCNLSLGIRYALIDKI